MTEKPVEEPVEEPTNRDIVVCSKCLRESPQTLDDWLALELIVEDDGEGTIYGRCPKCKEVVYFLFDGGEIDFGRDPTV